MGRPEWREEMIAQSNITRVFLTNQYNDDLEGLDTSFYSPCLRTEPFVVGLEASTEREALTAFLGRPLVTLADFAAALDLAFRRFTSHGMGYAALSTVANLQTRYVADEDAQHVLDTLIS